jgi:hypothetical protein
MISPSGKGSAQVCSHHPQMAWWDSNCVTSWPALAGKGMGPCSVGLRMAMRVVVMTVLPGRPRGE